MWPKQIKLPMIRGYNVFIDLSSDTITFWWNRIKFRPLLYPWYANQVISAGCSTRRLQTATHNAVFFAVDERKLFSWWTGFIFLLGLFCLARLVNKILASFMRIRVPDLSSDKDYPIQGRFEQQNLSPRFVVKIMVKLLVFFSFFGERMDGSRQRKIFPHIVSSTVQPLWSKKEKN